MAKQKVPLQTLEKYLPDNTCDDVIAMLNLHRVQLTITRERQSVLGDYRNAHKGENHRISVNGNLNKFSFLITLLHELAHLLTYEAHQHKVSPHGKEWKQYYSELLGHFINKSIFPEDIESTLKKSMKSPAASTCGDPSLLRVLRNYDKPKEGHFTVEQLQEGALFDIRDGRRFLKGPKIRTRFRCTEIGTGKQYLFSGLYEVRLAEVKNHL